jgi:ribonuclease HI
VSRFQDETFVVFDLEWVNYNKKNHIIEIGAIKVLNGNIIETFDKLLFTEIPINPIIEELTGISNDLLSQEGEKRDNTIYLFKLFIDDFPLVAHDIVNDIRVLSEEFDRFGVDFNNEFICSLQLSKKAFLFEKYNLKALSQNLELDLENFHRGFDDALICFEIFQKASSTLPKKITTLKKLKKCNRIKKKLKNIEIDFNLEFDHKENYKGFFDGASSGNPGKIGIGFAILDSNDEVIYKRGEAIGIGTNNEAEYMALLKLVETAKENGIENLEVFGDSQLVIKQILGEWKVKAENLRPIYRKVSEIFKEKKNYSISWIRREKNTLADKLSKV